MTLATSLTQLALELADGDGATGDSTRRLLVAARGRRLALRAARDRALLLRVLMPESDGALVATQILDAALRRARSDAWCGRRRWALHAPAAGRQRTTTLLPLRNG